MSTWFVLELETGVVPPPPPSEFGGGGEQLFAASPILAPEREEFRQPAEVTLERERVFAISAQAVHSLERVETSVAGSASYSKEVVFSIAATREPAHTWNAILADDEEILSML